MGSYRAVVIECDQTGETFVIKQGDVIGEHPHGAFPKRYEAGSASVTDAWVVAHRQGWRSFSKRNADGQYREVHAPPRIDLRRKGTPRWVAGDWVVCPTAKPDPPYSATALVEIERRARDEDRARAWTVTGSRDIESQVARLRTLGAVSPECGASIQEMVRRGDDAAIREVARDVACLASAALAHGDIGNARAYARTHKWVLLLGVSVFLESTEGEK